VVRAPEPAGWLHPAVAVVESAIAGRGWRATESIGAGAVVSRLGGRLAGRAELDALSAADGGEIDTIDVADGVVLVLAPRASQPFGNHSCDPNLGWADEYTLTASRPIAAGEELTSDYATSTADPAFVLACNCQTYRCRQLITGDDWRIEQLQRRYAGRWSPYVQGRIDAARLD
jgi:hypothetical protein